MEEEERRGVERAKSEEGIGRSRERTRRVSEERRGKESRKYHVKCQDVNSVMTDVYEIEESGRRGDERKGDDGRWMLRLYSISWHTTTPL